jgi:hypothetical protein
MHLTSFDSLLWASGLLGHLILLLVLVGRHHARTFPLFTSLIVIDITKTVVLLPVHQYGSAMAYFDTYWSLAILDQAAQIAVVYELFAIAFRPLRAWPRDFLGSLLGLIGLSVALAGVLTVLGTPHTRLLVQTVVIKSGFFTSVLFSELLIGMIALSIRVGLPWKSHVARIAQGLGAYSMVDILVEASHMLFGIGPRAQTYATLSHVRMIAYLICLGYWIASLLKKAPQSLKMTVAMRLQLHHVQSLVDSDLSHVRECRR